MYKLKICPSWVQNDSAPFVGKTFPFCECRCRLLGQVTAFVWALSESLFGSTFSLVPRLRRLSYCGWQYRTCLLCDVESDRAFYLALQISVSVFQFSFRKENVLEFKKN